jgi:AcrR family transcriptional regulator
MLTAPAFYAYAIKPQEIDELADLTTTLSPTDERAMNAQSRRYGGLSASERRAGRRARLLEAGLEFYGTVGFRHTTIPQLCSCAGVTARHFYEEFGTQEGLLRAVFDKISVEVLEAIRFELYVPCRTWTQIVREACAAYFSQMTEDSRRSRIFALEVVGISPELDLHRKRVRDAFANIASDSSARLVVQGGATDLDVRLLSIAVAGAAEALTIEWVLGRPRPAVETLIDQLAVIWIRTMQIDQLDPGLSP